VVFPKAGIFIVVLAVLAILAWTRAGSASTPKGSSVATTLGQVALGGGIGSLAAAMALTPRLTLEPTDVGQVPDSDIRQDPPLKYAQLSGCSAPEVERPTPAMQVPVVRKGNRFDYGYKFEEDPVGNPALEIPAAVAKSGVKATVVRTKGRALACSEMLDAGEGHQVGRVPPESIQRIIRFQIPVLRGCLQEHLQLARVDVELRLVIDRDGQIADLRLTGLTNPSASLSRDAIHEELASGLTCLADKLLQFCQFPSPPAGCITVDYPIVYAQDLSSYHQPQRVAPED